MIINFMGKGYDIEKTSTRQLLKLYRDFNKFDLCECCHDPVYVQETSAMLNELRPIVYAELLKREHIPNKIEAKEIRKHKALMRQNAKQRKYINR